MSLLTHLSLQARDSALLSPNLAPAALRHTLTRENRARCRRIARLALELRARTALLGGFERWISLGVNFRSITYETQRLRGWIARIERRQRRGGCSVGQETHRWQQCAGDESALDDGST